MKIGIPVYCVVCGRVKQPYGRSISAAAQGSYCTRECIGHFEKPYPGDLWPGETEEEFGFPVKSNNGVVER